MYQKLPNLNDQSIQVIKRLADGAFIPFDPANRDYQEYLAWLDEGNTPAEPEIVTVDPLTTPLNAVQFHAMLGILGKTEAVANAVEGLHEPARSIARARINYSQQFRRNHELFTQLAALVGVTDAEIDAAWPQALAIE